MKLFLKYLLFCPLFLVYGCEKEPVNYDLLNPNFIVGDSIASNIKFSQLDVKIGNSLGGTSLYQLDIDEDGQLDINLKTQNDYSPGGMSTQSSTMTILNTNLSIIGRKLIDTIANCTYQISDTTTQSIQYNRLSGYRCENGNDNLIKIMEFVTPHYYKLNDTIENQFILDHDIAFANKRSTMNYLIWNELKFIGYSKTRIYQKFIGANEEYIVFKLKKSNHDYLGWIKLRIKDYDKIELLGYAIQK